MEFLVALALMVLIGVFSAPMVERLAVWCFRHMANSPHHKIPMTEKITQSFCDATQRAVNIWDMDTRLMDLSISFDGKSYLYGGYRYDRVEDAIGYVVLVRSRALLKNAPQALTHGSTGSRKRI